MGNRNPRNKGQERRPSPLDEAKDTQARDEPHDRYGDPRTIRGQHSTRSAKAMHGHYKLDDEMVERLARSIAHGNYIETAVALCGINKGTFYNWLRKGNDEIERVRDSDSGRARVRQELEVFVFLVNAIETAQAEAEDRDLKNISFAADYLGEWRASAWRLERRHPDKWGRRDHTKTEITGEGGAPISFIQVAEQNAPGSDADDGDDDE